MATEVQPASKTWKLSLYELHRKLQEAITDNIEIAVSPRSLHSEFVCPICLDILKNTMITKECLHRFCQECIITALRSGNKECPMCRKKLVSKRSLGPDQNFDALISKIYPSRDEYEAHQENVLAKLNKHHNSAALSHSIKEELRLQAMNMAQRVRKQFPEEPSVSGEIVQQKCHQTESGVKMQDSVRERNSDLSFTGTMVDPAAAVNEIELVFKPHLQDDQPDLAEKTRYIKTIANATVDHLSKYLAIRMAVESKKEDPNVETPTSHDLEYTIYIASTPGQFTVLNGSMTLYEVTEKYWKVNKPLEMYYLSKNEEEKSVINK